MLRVEAGANATLTVAAGEELSEDELQLNGNLNVEASAPLCLTRACAGSGTLSWNKGELRIPNSTIAQSDIAEVNRAYKYEESGAKIAKSNVIQPSNTETAATVTVAKGKMLTSSATSTIEVSLSLTATSILDTSAGALTANTVALPVDGTVTVKANVNAAVLTVTDESSRAAANGTIVACDPAAEGKKFCLSAEGSNLTPASKTKLAGRKPRTI